MTTERVGIDQLGVYVPPYVLALDDLADARGVPREKIRLGLGAIRMAVVPSWEDTVTLGANAAARLFAARQVDPGEIGLLLLATETAVDHAKPASIFVHELLGMPSNCRTFELKHACYGGTAAVMIAADWVRSAAARGRKALVVATDIARYDFHSSAEFTQGAGAVALVIGREPRLLALDPVTGVFARNVHDFWRPLDRRAALVDGKFSLDCYLQALDGALDDYRSARDGGDDQAFTGRFAALLYHTPFPKMAYKAHLRLVETEWRRAGGDPAGLAEAAARSYAALVEPSLGAARVVGNTYTASLYFCLADLAERAGAALAGREIGLFSYGSGCCAEFFSGRFADGSAEAAACIGLADLLAARRRLSVARYEALAIGTDRGGSPAEEVAGFCHFAGVREQRRVYERRGGLV
jgi:hydroxymethylglutaryl-CoA synthase